MPCSPYRLGPHVVRVIGPRHDRFCRCIFMAWIGKGPGNGWPNRYHPENTAEDLKAQRSSVCDSGVLTLIFTVLAGAVVTDLFGYEPVF